MKVHYTVIIISAIITAVVVGVLLKFVGPTLGVPKNWNAAVTGGVAAAVSSVLGQLYSKKEEDS